MENPHTLQIFLGALANVFPLAIGYSYRKMYNKPFLANGVA